MKFNDIKVIARNDGLVAVEIYGLDGERIVDFTLEPDGAEKVGNAMVNQAASARALK